MVTDKVSHRRDRARAESEIEHGIYHIDGLDNVRVVIDVGAYHGSFVRHAKRLYPRAYIHAFEPDPRSFPRLEATTAGLSRVTRYNAAMAGFPGDTEFLVGVLPSCSALVDRCDPCRGVEETVRVACYTLPSFIMSLGVRVGVDILKLDCEGAEAEILEACERRDLERIGYITGEWHGLVIRDRVMRRLYDTHEAEFTTIKRDRGYFYAKRRV